MKAVVMESPIRPCRLVSPPSIELGLGLDHHAGIVNSELVLRPVCVYRAGARARSGTDHRLSATFPRERDAVTRRTSPHSSRTSALRSATLPEYNSRSARHTRSETPSAA